MPVPTGTLPTNEGARLALLDSLALVGTPAEPEFDAIAEDAVRLTGYDTALVTLMGADRCWFKAVAGILAAPGAPREIPRGLTYCQFALGSSGIFIVTDGLRDPRFSRLASVSGPGGFQAYAGVQLILPEGLSVGSLCVLHRSPRTPTAGDRAALRRLADQAVRLISARRPRPTPVRAIRDTLLIADDDEGIRGILATFFASRGMRTLVAGDGAEALRLYRENAALIAGVLTDFDMPGISGLALVRALIGEPNPPVCVVMSAHLEASVRSDFAAAGVRVILDKPFSFAALEVAVELFGKAVAP
jgi:CheY-like chemotaxis protein